MPALLLLLLTTVACLGAAPPSTSPGPVTGASTGQSASTHELRVGAGVTPAGSRVTVTFVGVSEDSRCPVGVSCIWEGDAVVELRIQPEAGSASGLSLHTSDRFPRQGTAHGLTIQLERLAPLPTSEGPVPAGSYIATISVVR